jgi:hypothetical protein
VACEAVEAAPYVTNNSLSPGRLVYSKSRGRDVCRKTLADKTNIINAHHFINRNGAFDATK